MVESTGDKTADFVESLWTAVGRVCRSTQCFYVLGIARSSVGLGTMDAFKLAEVFRKVVVNGQYRIAWVELEEGAIESLRTTETVLFNRGLPGKIFDNIDDAREWLLSESPPSSEPGPSEHQTSSTATD